MKQVLLLASLASLIITPAFAASDADRVAEMAMQCWSAPEGMNFQRASAIFEVSYNEAGEIRQIVTVEYQPVRKAGEQFAISAQDALIECANKTNIKSRTIRVVMRYVEPQATGPLIMKRSVR